MTADIRIPLPCGGASPMPIYIGGKWVPANGPVVDVMNPSDETVLAQVVDCGAADVDRAVAAARAAFDSRSWRRLPPSERTAMLWRLSELIEANRDELVLMEVANLGMPIHIAQSFVIDNAVASLRYYAGWATKIEGRTVKLGIPDMRGDGAIGPAFHAYSNKEPVGVVGAIVPWNVPLLSALAKIAPAITAGCTIVLKPALETPLTALRLAELIEEAGFPPGVFNLVTGGGTAGGGAGRTSGCRQDRLYRLHRHRPQDNAGGSWQHEEADLRAGRQVPFHHYRQLRSGRRHHRRRPRHHAEHRAGLLHRLAPLDRSAGV